MKALLIILVTVTLEVLLITTLLPPSLQPIEGAQMITATDYCFEALNVSDSTCTVELEYNQASLPILYRDRYASQPLRMHTRFKLELMETQSGIAALYLPKIADVVQINVNGSMVLDMGDLTDRLIRHWSRPVFARIPVKLLKPNNIVEITVTGYPQEGAGLHPFYFGPVEVLEPKYQNRLWLTKGMAQIGLAFMLLSSLTFSTLYFQFRRRKIYGWLALSGISASILSSNYAFVELPFSFENWAIIWNCALHSFVCLLYKFTARLSGTPSGYYERRYWIVILGIVLILTFGPKAYLIEMLGVLGCLTGFVTVSGLCNQINQRAQASLVYFLLPFLCFSFAFSAGLSDWLFFYIRPSPVNMQIGQLAFPLIIGVSIWLITSDLIKTTRENIALSESLQTKVDDATKRLVRTYEKLAVVQRRETLETERQRIMLDLHDGVAGHLVNTLAYMHAQPLPDPNVKLALESALQDMGLIIDSHEGHDTLVTSLAMLRDRVEPLLNQAGIEFVWRVDEEPDAKGSGPSLCLNVMRIAQECFTNTIKHSNASQITVSTSPTSITIKDNGTHTSKPPTPKGINRGLGIAGMKERAARVSADLELDHQETGMTISITWKP